MTFQGQELRKIKDAAKHMYLVYQNPELQFITNSVYKIHVLCSIFNFTQFLTLKCHYAFIFD
jgi:energy-coupling factor transporter ATP-binding protein EcfA2